MNFNKQDGISLVETLAVIVIGAIVASILYSILHQSQTQYNEQLKTNQQINDAAFALKIITKDLRKSKTVHPTSSESKLFLIADNEEIEYLWNDTEKSIERNGNTIVQDIESFSAIRLGKKVTVTLKTENGKTYSADIFIRGGN